MHPNGSVGVWMTIGRRSLWLVIAVLWAGSAQAAEPQGQQVSDLQIVDPDWQFVLHLPNSSWKIVGEKWLSDVGQVGVAGGLYSGLLLVYLEIVPIAGEFDLETWAVEDAYFLGDLLDGRLEARPGPEIAGRASWVMEGRASALSEDAPISAICFRRGDFVFRMLAIEKLPKLDAETVHRKLLELARSLELTDGAVVERDPAPPRSGQSHGPGWLLRAGTWTDVRSSLKLRAEDGWTLTPGSELLGLDAGLVMFQSPDVRITLMVDRHYRSDAWVSEEPCPGAALRLLGEERCFEQDRSAVDFITSVQLQDGPDVLEISISGPADMTESEVQAVLDRLTVLEPEERDQLTEELRTLGLPRQVGDAWSTRNRRYADVQRGLSWQLPPDRLFCLQSMWGRAVRLIDLEGPLEAWVRPTSTKRDPRSRLKRLARRVGSTEWLQQPTRADVGWSSGWRATVRTTTGVTDLWVLREGGKTWTVEVERRAESEADALMSEALIAGLSLGPLPDLEFSAHGFSDPLVGWGLELNAPVACQAEALSPSAGRILRCTVGDATLVLIAMAGERADGIAEGWHALAASVHPGASTVPAPDVVDRKGRHWQLRVSTVGQLRVEFGFLDFEGWTFGALTVAEQGELPVQTVIERIVLD